MEFGNVYVVAGEIEVGDDPVVVLGFPIGATFDIHVLEGWDELVDD